MTKHQETLVLMGLGGDKVVARQNKFINFLNKNRPNDAQILVFPTNWQTPETYTEKRDRLSAYIKLHPDIKIIYGISAGASLAMSLVPEMPHDTQYNFISGKLRRPETIGTERNTRAPALYESVVASEYVIANDDISSYNMRCYVGFLDGVLDIQDMVVPGVPVSRIPMINHSATIALAYMTTLRTL